MKRRRSPGAGHHVGLRPRGGALLLAARCRRRSAFLLCVSAGLLAACSGSPSSSSAPAASSSAATTLPAVSSRAGTPTSSATAVPATAAPATAAPVAATLSGCPAARSLSSFNGAQFGVAVDDVALAPDGSVWVASETANVILHLDGALHTLRTVTDPRGPEGIIVVADGTLLVAEQNANRVARFDPRTGVFTTFLALTNRTANAGVDGLGIDNATSRLLVPDSPNGTLLAVPLSGGAATVLARGLGRPVAAWAEPDGSILVALENAPGIVRVDASGRVTSIGHLDDLDEVIDYHGLLYVADLRGGTFRAVDPRTGNDRILVTGSPQPQGLLLRPDGRFLLADSTRQVIAVVPSCG
jgi:hypothetical protein